MYRCRRILFLILVLLLTMAGCTTTDWAEYPLCDAYSLYQLSPQNISLVDSMGNLLIPPHIRRIASAEGYLLVQQQEHADGLEDPVYYVLETESGRVQAALSTEKFEEICADCGIKFPIAWKSTGALTAHWLSSTKNSMMVTIFLSALVSAALLIGLIAAVRGIWKRKKVSGKIGLFAVAAALLLALLFMIWLCIFLACFVT